MTFVGRRKILCYSPLLLVQYKKALPSNLRPVATFADLAPAFQQLAESTRSRQVQQQREELMRALDEGNGFRFTDEEVNFKGAERAIKKVGRGLSCQREGL